MAAPLPANTTSVLVRADLIAFTRADSFRVRVLVRRRVSLELHGLDLAPAQAQSLRDPMHSIHDGPVCREDNRKREVSLVHELHVEDKAPPGQDVLISDERCVELAPWLEGHPSAGHVRSPRDESINVPRQ